MPVIKSLTSGDEVGSEAQFSSNTWQLLRRVDKLKLVNDVLIWIVSRNDKLFEQAVIPRALQQEILRAFHDDPTCGHLSRDTMLGTIQYIQYKYYSRCQTKK